MPERRKGILLLAIALVWVFGALFLGAALSSDRVISGNDLSFLPDHVLQHDTLWVYAGFIGCNAACPTALAKMSAQLNSQNAAGNTGFLFLNTLSAYDTRQARDYARQFHTSIDGFTADGDDLRTFSTLTNYRTVPSITESGQYEHTDVFFRFTKNENGTSWRLRRMVSLR